MVEPRRSARIIHQIEEKGLENRLRKKLKNEIRPLRETYTGPAFSLYIGGSEDKKLPNLTKFAREQIVHDISYLKDKMGRLADINDIVAEHYGVSERTIRRILKLKDSKLTLSPEKRNSGRKTILSPSKRGLYRI